MGRIGIRAALLGGLTVGFVGSALRSRLLVVVVRGESMTPTYQNGQRLLSRRLGPTDSLRRGDVVVVDRPDGGRVVKRVRWLPGETPEGRRDGGTGALADEEFFVVGDGTSSYDSRHFGPVRRDDLVGVILRPLR